MTGPRSAPSPASTATCRPAPAMIGTPAMAGDAGLRALAAIGRLPELLRDVRALGRRMDALERRLGAEGGPTAGG